MTIDRLDEVFKCIYQYVGQFNVTDIQNKLNEPYQGVQTLPYRDWNEVAIIIRKLSNEGMVDSVSNGQFLITFNGRLFYENTPKKYASRPYKYREVIIRNNETWTKVKTVATIINAIILIAIGIETCRGSGQTQLYQNQFNNIDSTKVKDTVPHREPQLKVKTPN